MNTILNDLPNSISSKLNNPIKLNINGLRSNSPKSKPNDLRVYPPINSDGENIGVMIYDHEKFRKNYKVNPHMVNFKKDRDTFHIGKYDYASDIRRYVKERKEIYSLSLPKKNEEASPLFVPYIDNVFLVITPNQINQFHNDEVELIDDDEPTVYSSGLFGDYDSDDTDDWLDDSYIPSTHRRVVFENVPHEEPTYDGDSLMSLFEKPPSNNDDNQTTAVVVFDEMNDPNYRATKEFLDKYPSTGQKTSKEQFLSNKFKKKEANIVPSQASEKEHVVKFLNDNPIHITLYDAEPEYIIEDIDDMYFDPDQTYISWQDENGDYIAVPSSPPNPTNMVEREVIVYDEKLFTDEEIVINGVLRNQTTLADFDDLVEAQRNIFDMPENYDMYCKPDPIYCDEHEVWNCDADKSDADEGNKPPSWSLCKWDYPEPTLDLHHISNYKTYSKWVDDAKWSCKCLGDISYHIDKENEEQQVELTVRDKIMLNDYTLFDQLPDYIFYNHDINIISKKDVKLMEKRGIFHIEKEPEIVGVEIDYDLPNIFTLEKSLSEQMQELLFENGENFILTTGKDKYVFSDPIEPAQPIKRRETLLDEVLKEEKSMYKDALEKSIKRSRGNIKPNDLIIHTVPTKEEAEFTSLLVNEFKKTMSEINPLSLNSGFASEDIDPIHSIPEQVRRKMRYAGRMLDYNSDFDLYTLTDSNFTKGKKLIQTIIMADLDKLWYTIRRMKGHMHNRAFDLKKDIKDDWLYIGSYRYPAKFITPYIDGMQNQHGLINCKTVTVPKGGTSLFLPYGKTVLAVSGEPILKK